MKIGIVNDSLLAVESIRRILNREPQHAVVWVAYNGIDAVQLCARHTPDLVLMDLKMPKMDGIDATRAIMKSTPCAILVVTASVSSNAAQVFEAMGAGALDAVATPVIVKDKGRKEEIVLLEKIGKTLCKNDQWAHDVPRELVEKVIEKMY
jgi:chemotaxis response regulator CheB